jgi:hypothetical protein
VSAPRSKAIVPTPHRGVLNSKFVGQSKVFGTIDEELKARLKTMYCNILRETGVPRTAYEPLGLTAKQITKWRQADPDFNEDVNTAMDEATQILESVLMQKAMKGDNLMLIFALKGRRPNVYRDNIRPEPEAKPTEIKWYGFDQTMIGSEEVSNGNDEKATQLQDESVSAPGGTIDVPQGA